MGRSLVWEEQTQGGETVYKGEVSMEGKFGCLRKGRYFARLPSGGD